ncbi:NAD(P)-dependent oxidoreductase [Solemya velum gill symbiont]|uniref:NAD(P)-dependent oxidoreductase n=1 Tax=Solemya velum gill symbiont TaxID=2340 RepID=UPI00273B4170|nr:NAD(P)-dependent oxidoreductase [Solemya velum gill symbiont]
MCRWLKIQRNLIGARELKMMKADALLINTARGGIVDEDALVVALKSGEIGAAGFDVLSVEPPREGNVLLDNPMPNLIVTPHVAWASQQSRQRLLNLVVESIDDYIAKSSVRRRLV